jgi:hypothetical protein
MKQGLSFNMGRPSLEDFRTTPGGRDKYYR